MYELHKRLEMKLKYLGEHGTEGGNTAYYGVVRSFYDEEGNLIKWYTTNKGHLPHLTSGEWYHVKATISRIETLISSSNLRVEVQRLKIKNEE